MRMFAQCCEALRGQFRQVAARFVAPAVAATAMLLPAGTLSAQDYEIWALDQGTNIVHIYNAKLEEVGRIDMGAHGGRVPHMIHFTSDYAHAFIASTGSGDVSVIRTADRQVVAVLKTGPGTHMAVVKPDDSAVIADVIGGPNDPRSGKLVEIKIDKQKGEFTIGRTLTIADDPMVKKAADKFSVTRAICHDYSADGRFACVTLGPALKDGGLVVLDTQKFELVAAFPVTEIRANCGTVALPDKKHIIINGGDKEVGVWYVLETGTHRVVKQGESRGFDAHGTWVTPNGREIWMVNRVSSNGIVIDAKTFEIAAELKDIGPTPDIIAMSPDSQFAFISLRGPNPVSAPHLAKGTTPGFSVVNIAERKLIKLIEPAKGNEKSDFHGIGVRRIR
jgi:DNA-binding beta-propeller fold protein YncE